MTKACKCEAYKLSKAKRLMMANGFRFSKWDVRCRNYPDVHGERVHKVWYDGQGLPSRAWAEAVAAEMMANRCPLPGWKREMYRRKRAKMGPWRGE